MIAVADTSPICYLILIGEIDLLPKIFGAVLVPQAVLAELLHEDAPATVRGWGARARVQLTVLDLRQRASAPGKLGPGKTTGRRTSSDPPGGVHRI